MLAQRLHLLKSYRLVLVLALAITVRLAVVIAFPSVFAFEQTGSVQGSDAYDIYARNLLTTSVYGYVPGIPDATIPPLYSYVLAALYATLGRGYVQVALLHILLDVLSIAMLYEIGRRLMPRGEAVGLLAGVCYALYPYLIFQNLTLIDTPLFMTLLYAFVLAVIILRERQTLDRGTWLAALAAGISLGLSILLRPVIAPLAIFVAIWFLFRLDLRATIMRLAPVALVGLLIVTPWIIRNFGVYHAFVPVANNSGMNFWFGNSRFTIPFLRAGYHPQWATPDQPVSADSRIASGQLFAQSFDYLRANPGEIPELLWVKLLAYWSVDIFPSHNPVAGSVPVIDQQGNITAQLNGLPLNDPVVAYSQPLFDRIGRAIHLIYFGTLLALAIEGIILTRREWRSVALLWFAQISMTLVYVIFIPATRYRVPTDPLLFLFSAYTLLWIVARLGYGRHAEPIGLEARNLGD